MRYWFDTEFMEDGEHVRMLSIGIVCEDGREMYVCRSDADHRLANEWVTANVLPHLDPAEDAIWTDRKALASRLRMWVGQGNGKPEFWAYYGDYDWVIFCQLFGRMIDLPKHFPRFCLDIKQRCTDLGNPKLPKQTEGAHNALADARHNKVMLEFLDKLAMSRAEK